MDIIGRFKGALASTHVAARIARTVVALIVVGGIAKVYSGWPDIRPSTVGFTLLLAIFLFAIKCGLMEAIAASIFAALLFDYYFQPPIYQLEIDDPEGWLAVAMFLCTAIGSSYLSAKVKRQAIEAQSHEKELARANVELEQRHKELEKQKQLSDSLLLSLFPPKVAEELRATGAVAPKYLEDVTVIFTDFVGFSATAERLSAEELVNELNDYFTEFDHIAARYQIEKLKTIGDSYMCISGFPVRHSSHTVDAVMAAFEMVQAAIERDRPDRIARWKVRIGIHTGPVLSGVVGIRKYAFDIWGETVNAASRLQSAGQPNRINISASTYARVKDFFECEYRGKILSKDQKHVDMYFVNAILPILQGGGTDGTSVFGRRYSSYFQKDPPALPSDLFNGLADSGKTDSKTSIPA